MMCIVDLNVFFIHENLWAQSKKYKQRIAARTATEECLFTDITDGAEYIKLYKEGGFLSSPNNIRFLVNTGIMLLNSFLTLKINV